MSYLQALNAGLLNPTNQVATYNYNTLDITSPTSVGFEYSESDSNNGVGWATIANDTWNEFYESADTYPAGIYMLSVIFDYSCSDAYTETPGIYFGLATSSEDQAQVGKSCSSVYNTASINMTVSFISTGGIDSNIHLSYNVGTIANITINNVAYNLTRIG